MSLATTKLTADDVRKAVELFWSTFLAKSEEELNDSYAPGSTVFQVAMSRSEPGRLGAMRRSREYFSPDTSMGLKLSPLILLCAVPMRALPATHFNSRQRAATLAQTHGGETGNRASHARHAPRRFRPTAHRPRTLPRTRSKRGSLAQSLGKVTFWMEHALVP
jgi:hypothetical protein